MYVACSTTFICLIMTCNASQACRAITPYASLFSYDIILRDNAISAFPLRLCFSLKTILDDHDAVNISWPLFLLLSRKWRHWPPSGLCNWYRFHSHRACRENYMYIVEYSKNNVLYTHFVRAHNIITIIAGTLRNWAQLAVSILDNWSAIPRSWRGVTSILNTSQDIRHFLQKFLRCY